MEFGRELRDHFGDYLIVRHLPQLPALTRNDARVSRGFIPAAAGMNRSPTSSRDFRCRCGKKLVDVQVGVNRKPRGLGEEPVLISPQPCGPQKSRWMIPYSAAVRRSAWLYATCDHSGQVVALQLG